MILSYDSSHIFSIEFNKSTHAIFKWVNVMMATFQLTCLTPPPLIHMKVLVQQVQLVLVQNFTYIYKI